MTVGMNGTALRIVSKKGTFRIWWLIGCGIGGQGDKAGPQGSGLYNCEGEDNLPGKGPLFLSVPISQEKEGQSQGAKT